MSAPTSPTKPGSPSKMPQPPPGPVPPENVLPPMPPGPPPTENIIDPKKKREREEDDNKRRKKRVKIELERDLDNGIGWPSGRPREPRYRHGWFLPTHERVFERVLADVGEVKVILELGSWYGSSTEWLCERCPDAAVYAVDLWDDSFILDKQRYDLGVPSCRDAFTPSTRVVSRNDGSGWSLFRFRGRSDRFQ